jgi:hypothetical protein
MEDGGDATGNADRDKFLKASGILAGMTTMR